MSRKKLLGVLMALSLLLSCFYPVLATNNTTTQSQTENKFLVEITPIPKDVEVEYIKTAEELSKLNDKSGYFALANDINLTAEWIPIKNFSGTLDGQGYSINNLFILKDSKRQSAGLFGELNYSITIKNLGLNIGDKEITGTHHTGGLIGFVNFYGSIGRASLVVTVDNCFVTGNVNSNGNVTNGIAGGLLGTVSLTNKVEVTNSYATGNVSVIADNCAIAGGLIGNVPTNTIITNCFATGNISAYANSSMVMAGGLLGNGVGIIKDCFATGDVFSSGEASYSGGLIGYQSGGIDDMILNCYATGNVSAELNYSKNTHAYSGVYAGGLVGNSLRGVFKDSYATGDVSSIVTIDKPSNAHSHNSYSGGLIGSFGNAEKNRVITVTNCFAVGNVRAEAPENHISHSGGLIGYINVLNNELFKVTNSYRLSTQKITGDKKDESGKVLTSAQMKTQSSFENWNFINVWEMGNRFPKLKGTKDLFILSNVDWFTEYLDWRVTQIFSNHLSGYGHHLAVDLVKDDDKGKKDENAEIKAIYDGRVYRVSPTSKSGGNGNMVILKHEIGDKIFYSLYAHMADDSVKVKQGTKVKAGDTLGIIGGTGGFPVHLHLAVYTTEKDYSGIDTNTVPWGYADKAFEGSFHDYSDTRYFDPLEVIKTQGQIILDN